MSVAELYPLELPAPAWDTGDWAWVVTTKFFPLSRGGFFPCDWLVVIICPDGDIWFLTCCFGSGTVDCCDVCACCVAETWLAIWRWGDKVPCKGGDVMGGAWGEEFWDCPSASNFWCTAATAAACACAAAAATEGIWGTPRSPFSWGNATERAKKNI